MNDPTASVSIIIVNYNTPQLVTTLIESIKEFTRSIDYEFVIVNNGCHSQGHYGDDSQRAGIRTIDSPENLGFGRAVNLAVKASENLLLLFANSDCRIDSNVLPRMAKFLSENPNCSACSPRLLGERGQTDSSIRKFPTHQNIGASRGAFFRKKGEYTLPADDTRRRAEAMSATFMLVRRDAFAQVGGFDERYFMYVEDTDLCKSFFDQGREVWYLGDITVHHKWGASTRQIPLRMKFHHHLSIWKYFQKHFSHHRASNLWLAAKLMVNFTLVSVQFLFNQVRSH